MRKLFNVSDDKEVRLWSKYMNNMYEQLKRLSSTLQEASLYPGQVILIEEKNANGTWPRQEKQYVISWLRENYWSLWCYYAYFSSIASWICCMLLNELILLMFQIYKYYRNVWFLKSILKWLIGYGCWLGFLQNWWTEEV